MPCPVDPVPSVESGSPTGLPSHGQGPAASPIRQEKGLGDFQVRLLAALTAQTHAMLALTSRLDMLITAMSEDEAMDEDLPPTQYLDGSPVR